MNMTSQLSFRELLIASAVFWIWFPAVQISAGPVVLNLTEVSLVAIFPIVLGSTTYRLPVRPTSLIAVLAFLWMAMLSVLQLMYVEDMKAGLSMAVRFSLCVVFALSLLGSPDRPRVVAMSVKVFIVSGFFSLLISNADFFTNIIGGFTIFHLGGSRSAGFFQHPNQYAIWIICLLPLVMLTIKKVQFAILSLANVIVALLVSGSKVNIFLALVIILICIGIRLGWRVRLIILISVAAGFVTTFSAVLLEYLYRVMDAVNPRYGKVFREVLEDPTGSVSFLARVALWEEAIDYGAANPLLGIGGGQAYTVLQSGIPHAHNLILQYFMTYGVIGLGALLTIFVAAFIGGLMGVARNVHEKRLKYAFVISLVAIFVSNQSSDSMAGNQVLLFGIIVGFILCASEIRANEALAKSDRFSKIDEDVGPRRGRIQGIGPDKI